jgi:OOP family OmpA-OmpF porin
VSGTEDWRDRLERLRHEDESAIPDGTTLEPETPEPETPEPEASEPEGPEPEGPEPEGPEPESLKPEAPEPEAPEPEAPEPGVLDGSASHEAAAPVAVGTASSEPREPESDANVDLPTDPQTAAIASASARSTGAAEQAGVSIHRDAAAGSSSGRGRRGAWFVGAVVAAVIAVLVAVWVAARAGDDEVTDPAGVGTSAAAVVPGNDGAAADSGEQGVTPPSSESGDGDVPSSSAPATTAVEVTDRTSTTIPADTGVPLPLLIGAPEERLPGGQEWPNGLYTDAVMYMRGAVPSEEASTDLQSRVEAILGPGNVRNEFVIDPSVPPVEQVIVRLGPSVLFLPDSATVNPTYYEGFGQWAAFLQVSPDVTVTIVGHTDSIGPLGYNVELARRRAEAARQQIVQYGIDPARVEILARGPEDPVASNDTREGRALNRRIEFAVSGLFGTEG